ncbi:hypothetical protein HYU21_02370, partial [Candidatus Woesearchaeota archaeon]|nr:hypothetical protein [Candidatus Woesearchaeota archaeon]
MKDIISMRDFSKEEIITILDTAADVKRAINDPNFNHDIFREKYGRSVNQLLKDIKVATLFIENSTRTNYSFRTAVMTAGGDFDGFSSDDDTSLKKGETWADTAAMFAGYGYDALVMRSTTEGLPRWTKESLEEDHELMKKQYGKLGQHFNNHVPLIINGGDGKNQHPTQCFLDLFTMREIAQAENKDLDGLSLSLLNDLAHGRTNASLMSVAHLFDFKLHLAYPKRFGPQQHRLEEMLRRGVEVHDHQEDMLEAMRESSIAYHSRPQKERVGKGEDLITIKQWGQINQEKYNLLGEHAPYLMHPLPVDAETFEEISADMKLHPKNITNIDELFKYTLSENNLTNLIEKNLTKKLHGGRSRSKSRRKNRRKSRIQSRSQGRSQGRSKHWGKIIKKGKHIHNPNKLIINILKELADYHRSLGQSHQYQTRSYDNAIKII